ncbi:hypothetical protein SAMN05216199_2345 [Pedococcus cremeus]|uniref:Secreted protein n=1 Tax=Pedococcus cremeus TaxID=587636 RepID=A0A1H9VHR9_9MICO|nr:hypothetical protein [Pedococcus cremeus]SES21108.1 hypothetical protein SAMN05216199_2345 [Pedococcus cremeus]
MTLRFPQRLTLSAFVTLLLALATVVTAPNAEAAEYRYRSYVTGYSYWDNTPAGSATIAYPRTWYPTKHTRAGGTGTYSDPITVAVGHSISRGVDTPLFKPGTRFYIPNLRRYFIVEDTCGDGPKPQLSACWTGFPKGPTGAQNWLDLWVGGAKASRSVSDSCMSAITKTVTAIIRPRSDYVVVSGDISGSRCARQYGNTAVRR